MTTSITDFPFVPGSGAIVTTGTGLQAGNVALVPADNSAAVAVLFPAAYKTSVNSVTVSVYELSAPNQYALSAQVSNVTVTGFSVSVQGGPTGSTVTVYWQATGQ